MPQGFRAFAFPDAIRVATTSEASVLPLNGRVVDSLAVCSESATTCPYILHSHRAGRLAPISVPGCWGTLRIDAPGGH
jgi:hypothetical protein